MTSPVRGLRPTPRFLGLTTNTPKPRSSIRSPRCIAAFIASNKASTAVSALVLGTPVFSETRFTISSLITSPSIEFAADSLATSILGIAAGKVLIIGSTGTSVKQCNPRFLLAAKDFTAVTCHAIFVVARSICDNPFDTAGKFFGLYLTLQ